MFLSSIVKKIGFPGMRETVRTFRPDINSFHLEVIKYDAKNIFDYHNCIASPFLSQHGGNGKDGKAPQPIKLSVRTTVWLESEIDSFLDSCVSQVQASLKIQQCFDKPDSAIA